VIKSITRSFRLDSNNPNKIAYVVIPYLDTGNFNDDNISFKTVRTIVSKLYKEDEHIITKISLLSNDTYYGNNIKNKVIQPPNIVDNVDGLNVFKLRLIHSRDINSTTSAEQNVRFVRQMLLS
jgi:hypothetical protein